MICDSFDDSLFVCGEYNEMKMFNSQLDDFLKDEGTLDLIIKFDVNMTDE